MKFTPNSVLSRWVGADSWPFYLPDEETEQLWTWVSPRRFVIISAHDTNEKVNHFYSNKMHDHFILALRTVCWSFQESSSDYGKKKHRTIALNEKCRIATAHHETFLTGFECKYGRTPVAQTSDGSHGKRKHQDASSREPAKQFAQHDPTGMYSADDMQALNEAFQDEPTQPSTGTRPQPKKEKVNQWTYGQVPEFDPTMTGASQRNTQLAYARKLLAAVMEAACQLETVVENLEQMPQDPSASNPENQTANTVETPEEEDCSGTEPNKRDSYQ